MCRMKEAALRLQGILRTYREVVREVPHSLAPTATIALDVQYRPIPSARRKGQMRPRIYTPAPPPPVQTWYTEAALCQDERLMTHTQAEEPEHALAMAIKAHQRRSLEEGSPPPPPPPPRRRKKRRRVGAPQAP